MYKVFIDNRPATFGFNSGDNFFVKSKEAKNILQDFVLNNLESLKLNLKSEKAFWKIFSDYKYVEAAGGIVERNGKYLFILRNDKWDIPKGKIEKGEGVNEAAIREIEEECGLEKPVITGELSSTFHTYEFKGKLVLKKTYWFILKDINPKKLVPQQEEGITELTFLSPAEFDLIFANTYPSIVDVLNEFRKKIN